MERAFFVPGSDPVFVFPRMFAAFDLKEEPQGELVVVNETDDGFAIFDRVARGLGATGKVALGDRVWAETVLNLGRSLGFDRLRTGSTLVNELRRVKTPEELRAMARAIRTVEETMAAVAPLVVPGATMAQLAETVEHELSAAGSRTPSFTTHIFTGLGDSDFDSGTNRKVRTIANLAMKSSHSGTLGWKALPTTTPRVSSIRATVTPSLRIQPHVEKSDMYM